MPELLLSLLDFIFVCAAIAATLWVAYLIWEICQRQGQSSTLREGIEKITAQLRQKVQTLKNSNNTSTDPIDLPPRYIPQPTQAERLEQGPETTNSPPQTPLPSTTASGEILTRALTLVQGNREILSQLREQIRNRHPGKSEGWIWKRILDDLEQHKK